jgi:hypothetical protein
MGNYLLFLLALILCSVSLIAETYGERLEKLRRTESKIDFYGRLLDQYDNPVPCATISYRTSGYGLIGLAPRYKSNTAVSDEEGKFEIHDGKWGLLFIDKIDCTGYEFKFGNGNMRGFEFRSNRTDRYRPDKENPVVFRLRKKHSEAVVLRSCKSRIWLSNDTEEEWTGWDLAKGAPATSTRKGNADYFWDYKVTGENYPEKKEWTVTIKMNGENAGILVSDKLLYEAPADGYAKEVALTFKYSDKPPLKHLYLRLRDCGMYARLDMEHGNVSEKGVYFSCKMVINPYGSRSLEPLLSTSQEDSSSMFVQCHNDADRAMQEQRLAPRPPFEQWIREGKAKY